MTEDEVLELLKYTRTYNSFHRCYEWHNHAGQLHRDNRPAVEYANGDKVWYQNDQLHRIDGPACEYADGDKSWYQNGLRHRLDGPAVEYVNGRKDYWIDGTLLTTEEFNKRTKQ